MKKNKVFALMLALCLVLTVPALAKDDGRALMLNATVECLDVYAVKAPFTGDLLPFSLRAGDAVTQDDVLFTLEQKTLYAPMDGVVGAVYATAGDTAASMTQRYSALVSIDPVNRFRVECNARTGYDSVETRDIRVGTPVWLKKDEGDKRAGEGWIIAVNGSAFTVEVISGDLQFNDSVNVFNAAEMLNRNKLSRGVVSAAAPVSVSGTGTIASVLVKRGDTVKRGDALLTYIPDDMANGVPAADVKAAKSGIVQSVSATQGATANKGQALAMIYDESSMVLSAQLDEGDYPRVTVGATAQVVFEELALEPITATVRSISHLGAQGETATYTVLLDFDRPAAVQLGMHATVTIE